MSTSELFCAHWAAAAGCVSSLTSVTNAFLLNFASESGRSSELITKHSPDAIDLTLQSSLLDNIQEIKS